MAPQKTGFLERIFKKQIEKKSRQLANNTLRAVAGKIQANSNAFGSMAAGAKWTRGLSSSGRERIIDHYEMLQNSRDAFHDSMDARSIVERFADSVVDSGLILESTPAHEILGITQEQAEEWGSNVSRRFHLYAGAKNQNRSGVMNFYQAQRLYEICQHRDNDIFVRLFYSASKKLQNSLQYDFIDPNQIRGVSWTSTYAQSFYTDGIERNPDGTERSYKVWIIDKNENGKYKDIDVLRISPKSGRIMMLHGFNPEYPGQGRGYSRLGFALQELENITDLTLAQIKKAINQSNLVAFTENEQQDSSNPFEDQIENDLSALGTRLSEESQEIIDTLAEGITLCDLPETNLKVPGSMAVFNLRRGDKFKPFENTTPAESFKDFITVFSERLAAAAGIPIEVVLMKFGESYSASRATLVLFWRVIQMWRDEMAADFLNPFFEMWLTEEIAAGRISAPGWQDPVLRAAWLSCNWIGSQIPNIDPAKEAKARKDNIEMNLTTLERESRNHNGSSAKDNIAKNKETFKDLPVPPWGSGSKNSSSDMSQEDTSQEDMEDNDNG